MSAFHLSIYRSKIFSTAFPALETFIPSFIESSISIPLPLSTLIPKGRSSIKIIDLFSKINEMKNIFRRVVQFRSQIIAETRT